MKVINKLPSLLLKSTLRLKRKILGENRIVIVATPHKVGSTWLFNLIKDSARLENGINHLPPDKIETGTLLLDTDSIPIVENLHGSMIFKSHSFPPQKKLKENIRLVTMYRDPRDVIVSSSFFLANIDEDVGRWGEKFSNLPIKSRIMTLIEKGDFLLDRLEKWHDDNNSYKVRYEELLSHAALELQNVLRFCNLTAAPGRINKVISANSFNRKSGRDRGFEDNKSFYRKGIAGDWRNRFDEECSEIFKTSKDGRWNALLLEMGYEKKLDWKI